MAQSGGNTVYLSSINSTGGTYWEEKPLLKVLPFRVKQSSILHLPVLKISDCFCSWSLPCSCSSVVINIICSSSRVCSPFPAEE